jgi:hypothetical protein
MKDYKNKYLKYKNKYLNLLNQYGGNKTFYIYTTGIAEWGYFEGQSAWYMWNNFLRNKIIELIPKKFNEIIITHYDPLLHVENKEQIKY